VPAFAIQRHNVTNARFLEFVDAGGYRDPQWWQPSDWQWVASDHITHPLFGSGAGQWRWRGMFDVLPLPLSSTYVSHAGWPMRAGAARVCRAKPVSACGKARRPENVPTRGAATSRRPRAACCFLVGSGPAAAPAGASAWGVEDLAGNGWEWTSTIFAPFQGFRPMASYPEYSADFFDGEHMVMKGASPATARELLRPTFRNWFRPRYPYVYASFRCVRAAG
jgi:formylglycine-generating enzyme required for sulfatase activity